MQLQPSQKPKEDYKQMHQPFSLANPSPLASRDHHVKSSRKPPNRPHPISPLEHTRILTMDTTNAQSVLKMSQGAPRVSGHVGRVGLFFIWGVSRSGQQMKARQQRDNRRKMERRLPRGSGAVPAAIYQRTPSPRTSTVGVRRNSIRDQRLVCHLSRAVRHVHDPEFSPSLAHTLVDRHVMPVLARLAG